MYMYVIMLLSTFFRHPKTYMYSGEGHERVLLFLPMFHSIGLMLMFTSLFEGHTIIAMRNYDMNTLLKHSKTYKVNLQLFRHHASPYCLSTTIFTRVKSSCTIALRREK